MHYYLKMHTHGVRKVKFASLEFRRPFNSIGNVIKRLIHAFSSASSSYDADGVCMNERDSA